MLEDSVRISEVGAGPGITSTQEWPRSVRGQQVDAMVQLACKAAVLAYR